jgi:hypothetical protein
MVWMSLASMSTAPQRLLEIHDKAGSMSVWGRFSRLRSYYTGLYQLIPEELNVPQYPPMNDGEGEEIRASGRGALGVTAKSRIFDPYPDYSSVAYRSVWAGEYRECSFGEGRLKPEVRVFDGVPEGMPDAAIGSDKVLGLDSSVCFDRYGRLGSYGYGYAEAEGGLGKAMFDGRREKGVETAHGVGGFPLRKIDWRGVDWGLLQKQCFNKNRDRFANLRAVQKDSLYPAMVEDTDWRKPSSENKSKKKHPRTAVLLRTWTGYRYTENDVANMRSLISELSLLSGGEYTVHILVHVKDQATAIWASPDIYRRTLEESGLPKEFWGIAELWNEPLMRSVYSRIPDEAGKWQGAKLSQDKVFMSFPVHEVYRSTFMPVQWFSQRHPEYDFVWNWEMDVRYTGHFYHLFDRLNGWTKKQPRKGLWERNARFYIPKVHGGWETFSQAVSATSRGNETVWGPVKVEGVELYETDPSPSDSIGSSQWGVGEDADLITLNPLFDPEGTNWILRNDVTSYKRRPPRRAAIITAVRLSRRLLETMHRENAEQGHAMFSEMWPATVALHHGFKAVFAPHPVYVDRKWPLGFLEKVFNSNPKDGSSGGNVKSVFGAREHNFKGTTWYYDAQFGPEVYRRWVGSVLEGEAARERSGRMCLRGWLIHPVKRVE